MMTRALIAAGLAAASLSALPAHAATTVNTGGARGLAIAGSGPVGQTFTATGNRLDSFGFELVTGFRTEANGPVTLTIRAGGGLNGAILATATATPAVTTGRTGFWQDFSFTDLALVEGGVYTALLSSTSKRLLLGYGPTISLTGANPGAGLGPDPYSGGTLISTEEQTGYCTINACDANFRFTTSNVAAIPEPSSWALMLAGFAMVGGGMRYRRRTVRFAA